MNKMQARVGRRRHVRIVIWSLFIVLVGTLLLPLGGYVYVAVSGVQAEAAQSDSRNAEVNPRSNYWRAVREGDKGYTSASGPYTTTGPGTEPGRGVARTAQWLRYPGGAGNDRRHSAADSALPCHQRAKTPGARILGAHAAALVGRRAPAALVYRHICSSSWRLRVSACCSGAPC